jgi:hypothetical protein
MSIENRMLADLPEPYDMDAADLADAEACELAEQREVDGFMPSLFDILSGAVLAQARSLNPLAEVPKAALLAHYNEVAARLREETK